MSTERKSSRTKLSKSSTPPRKDSSLILVIPDTHAPYQHPEALEFLARLKNTYQPTTVIQLGDLVDFHRLARWEAEPDSPGVVEELNAAKDFVADLSELFPTMQIVYGNHDLRPYRKMKNLSVPSAFVRSFREVIEAPETWSFQEQLVMENIIFEHGDGLSGQNAAIRAATTNRMSTVIGHVHSFSGVTYLAGPRDTIFAVNSGCLVDQESVAMAYGKVFRHKPVLGATVILNRIPMFIPMPGQV